MIEFRSRQFAFITLFFLIVAALPWIPYLGTNTAFIDGIRFLGNATQNNYFVHPGRPLTPAPWVLAYALTPDSLLAAQGLMLLTHWLCALSLFGILAQVRLPANLQIPGTLALLIATIYAVHSADTAKYWVGTLSSHTSNLTFFLAILFFLRYARKPSLWSAAGMLVMMTYSLNIHERYYPLIPFILLLSWPEVRQRPIRIIGLWLVVPLLRGLLTAYLLLQSSNSYQVATLAQDEPLTTLLRTAATQSARMIGHTLNIPLQNPATPVFFGISAAVAGIVFAGLWYWLRGKVQPLRGTVWFVYAGIAIIVLGYLPFAFSEELRFGYSRRLFLSIVGASLIWGVLLWGIGRFIRKPAALIALVVAVFAFFHTYASMRFHNALRRAAIVEMQAVDQVLQTVGELPEGAVLWLLYEQSQQYRNFEQDWLLQAQLTYFYEHPVFVCFARETEDGVQIASPHCEIEAAGVHVLADRETTTDTLVPYSDVVVMQMHPLNGRNFELAIIQDVEAVPLGFPPDAPYNPQAIQMPFDFESSRYQNMTK